MLVLVAARLFTALLPYRLLAPEWYLSAGLELVNCSPVLLTGLLLLAWSTRMKSRTGKASAGGTGSSVTVRVAFQVALWVYVLLIPLQLLASVLTDFKHQERQRAQWGVVQKQLASARQQELPPAQLERLQAVERQLRDQRDRNHRQLRLSLFRDGLRVVVSAAALAALFHLAGRVIQEWSGAG